jgi:ribokinase
MVGAVGRDAFAAPAQNLLRAGGVDLSSVRTVDEPTGVALILVDSAGENVIAVIPGANSTLAPATAAALDFHSGDALVLQLEVPVAAIEVAARRARSGGAHVLLNFAPFRTDALPLIDHATHLVVNESECSLIAEALGVRGSEPLDQAKALAERYKITVIVTLGKDGAVVVEGGLSQKVPALAVRAIDTVGAGDTFCGYLAAGLADGQPMAEALALASAAASLACTKAGAQPSIPARVDVERAQRGALPV